VIGVVTWLVIDAVEFPAGSQWAGGHVCHWAADQGLTAASFKPWHCRGCKSSCIHHWTV